LLLQVLIGSISQVLEQRSIQMFIASNCS